MPFRALFSPRFFLLIALLLCWGGAGRVRAGSGLDAAVPVGKWLNGVFPSATPGGSGSWQVVDAFPNLSFRDPIVVVPEPRSRRLHVVGKEGYIWSFDNVSTTAVKTLMLDISARVQITDNEGLVSLAFHPEFGLAGSPNKDYFYVFYTYRPTLDPNPDHNGEVDVYDRISRFTLVPGSPAATAASELIYIQNYDRHPWHNGAAMFFGADGFLYISTGDEGGDDDPYFTSQRLDAGLYGGMVRIDVDNNPAKSHPIRRHIAPGGVPRAGWPASFSQGYGIPNDNPWLDPAGTILEEMWCLGLRSPHTMTYDAQTGRIFVGDVGQDTFEEVNQIVKAGNYQWDYLEATFPGPRAKPNPLRGTDQPPVWAYGRGTGVCVICGPVYRGREHGAALGGKLLVADHEFGYIWTLTFPPGGGAPTATYLTTIPNSGFHNGIASWGVDQDSEVLMVKLSGYVSPNGKILKLARTGTNIPEPPLRLSQTGAFTSLATLTPDPKLIPYEPAAPFWSDGAAKKRWITIPNDGTPNSAGEQISFSTASEWTFPEGTVLVKHFDLPVDARNATVTKRVETRFFVRGTTGWYGFTYRWREDGTEADLVFDAETRDFTLTKLDGTTATQRWDFPARQECLTCHNANAGSVLGLRTHQLNWEVTYPATGRKGNQIETLAALGFLTPAPSPASLAGLAKAARWDDLTASLETRGRSYLDSNCSYCHRPGGVNANFDARFTTALASQNLVNGPLVKNFDVAGQAVIRAHDVPRSIAWQRAASLDTVNRMPPLAKNRVDDEGLRVVREWINSIDPAANPARGVEGYYYTGNAFQTFTFKRTDSVLDFDWGTGAPDVRLPGDNFTTTWRGRLLPQVTGRHVLYSLADTGARVWVKGQKLLDNWAGTPQEVAATVDLVAGQPVALQVDLVETTGSAKYRLSWTPPGQAKAAIPAIAFLLPTPQNGGPVAVNDVFTGTAGQTASLDVLANDFDYEGNLAPVTLAIDAAPAAGSGTAVVDAAAGKIQFTAPAAGGTTTFVYTVSDAARQVSNRALVTVNTPAAAALWLAGHFSASECEDPVRTWALDSDGDGVTNLLEYALGTDPCAAGSRPVVETALVEEGAEPRLQLSVARSATAGATLVVESSADLQEWSAVPEADVVPLATSPERLTIQCAMPQEGRLYFRLRATLVGGGG